MQPEGGRKPHLAGSKNRKSCEGKLLSELAKKRCDGRRTSCGQTAQPYGVGALFRPNLTGAKETLTGGWSDKERAGIFCYRRAADRRRRRVRSADFLQKGGRSILASRDLDVHAAGDRKAGSRFGDGQSAADALRICARSAGSAQ